MKHIVSKDSPPDLTATEWEFVGKTPASGESFYNKRLNQVAVKYRKVLKVYERQMEDTITTARRPYPCDFGECIYYEL